MTDLETTIDWATQIAMIRQRFAEALRSGETIDSLDIWLEQVPMHVRSQLRDQLERSCAEVQPGSTDSRVLSSDAVLGCAVEEDHLFSCEDVTSGSAVQDCPTFCGLSKPAARSLQERLELKSFPGGSQLLSQGEQARGLYLILQGSVEIVDAETGKQIACDGAGSVMGEMSLLTGQACSADVVATSEVEALMLSAKGYHQLIKAHPELEIAISQLVSDRLGGRRHDALCGKTIGDYRLVRCINRGGMGVVYEANRVADSVAVALKMLRHRFIYDDQMKGRFDQEARLLEDLRHPNIVSFRDHFLAFRTRFLVLDLCDGADLFRVLRLRGPLDESIVRAVLGQIAEGLLYAHASGVVHRDLKPGNVLVDRGGQVKLTDFGLSKLLESDAVEGKAVGTPCYMPPEQFQSEQVGPACDWYALGCLICEMLTGKILFPACGWSEMFRKKVNQQPSDEWPAVDASPELRRIIHGALQPKAEDRHVDLDAISRWAKNVRGIFGR